MIGESSIRTNMFLFLSRGGDDASVDRMLEQFWFSKWWTDYLVCGWPILLCFYVMVVMGLGIRCIQNLTALKEASPKGLVKIRSIKPKRRRQIQKFAKL